MIPRQQYQPIFSKPDKEDSKTAIYMVKKMKQQCRGFDKMTGVNYDNGSTE